MAIILHTKYKTALRYVAEHQETSTSFSDYMLSQNNPASASLIDEDFFIQTSQLDQLIKP